MENYKINYKVTLEILRKCGKPLTNKPKKDTKIFELRTDDDEPIDLTQIPNAFKKYFIELGVEICNDIPPSVTIPEDYFVDFQCPSNTLIVARIVEKLIHSQIYEYLIKSNLQSISQHRFRPLHSTCTALPDIMNRWYQNMDIG